MKVAIVHEWLTVVGGSEKCLKEMTILFPEADVFALVADNSCLEKLNIDSKRVTTTFIQKLPFAKTKWKAYLPLFPLAIESLDLSSYDLIISSSHAVAKGVIVNCNQVHISYVYSPMRYAWDLTHRYLKETGLDKGFKGLLTQRILHKLRLWDLGTSNRVDEFIPISKYIENRIWRVYRRKSYKVIYPPVAVEDFTLNTEKDDFYLIASRLVPYKRMPLLVKAFKLMPDKKLVVIGDGPERPKIEKLVKDAANIQYLGYQSFEVLQNHMQRAKAFLFAADEDFGIIPVEAQACGTPVIAFGKGGSLETVNGKFVGQTIDQTTTGVFFDEQTESSVVDSVNYFEEHYENFNPNEIRKFAESFAYDIFRNSLKSTILEIFEKYKK